MTARSIPGRQGRSGGVPRRPGCGPLGRAVRDTGLPRGSGGGHRPRRPRRPVRSRGRRCAATPPPTLTAFASFAFVLHLVPVLRGAGRDLRRHGLARRHARRRRAVRPHRHRLGPRRAPLLVSAGTEHGDYGTRSSGPDPVPVADALVDHLAALTRRRTVVNLRRLRVDGPAWAAVYSRPDLGRTSMGSLADAAVVRFDQMDDPTDVLRRLGRKHEVPQLLRRLGEAHGKVLYVAKGDPDLDAALDAMRDMLTGDGVPTTALALPLVGARGLHPRVGGRDGRRRPGASTRSPPAGPGGPCRTMLTVGDRVVTTARRWTPTTRGSGSATPPS